MLVTELYSPDSMNNYLPSHHQINKCFLLISSYYRELMAPSCSFNFFHTLTWEINYLSSVNSSLRCWLHHCQLIGSLRVTLRGREAVDRPCRTQSIHLVHEALISTERRPTWLKLNKAFRLLSDVQNSTRLPQRPTWIGVASLLLTLSPLLPSLGPGNSSSEGSALIVGLNGPVKRSIWSRSSV